MPTKSIFAQNAGEECSELFNFQKYNHEKKRNIAPLIFVKNTESASAAIFTVSDNGQSVSGVIFKKQDSK